VIGSDQGKSRVTKADLVMASTAGAPVQFGIVANGRTGHRHGSSGAIAIPSEIAVVAIGAATPAQFFGALHKADAPMIRDHCNIVPAVRAPLRRSGARRSSALSVVEVGMARHLPRLTPDCRDLPKSGKIAGDPSGA
jgi:hypothetical protein